MLRDPIGDVVPRHKGMDRLENPFIIDVDRDDSAADAQFVQSRAMKVVWK
jgi:hypothetical protein